MPRHPRASTFNTDRLGVECTDDLLWFDRVTRILI